MVDKFMKLFQKFHTVSIFLSDYELLGHKQGMFYVERGLD